MHTGLNPKKSKIVYQTFWWHSLSGRINSSLKSKLLLFDVCKLQSRCSINIVIVQRPELCNYGDITSQCSNRQCWPDVKVVIIKVALLAYCAASWVASSECYTPHLDLFNIFSQYQYWLYQCLHIHIRILVLAPAWLRNHEVWQVL